MRVSTWAVEPPARGNIKHGPGDGEQNPPAIATAELFESARGISRVEQCRSVGTWHPRVASFEFRWRRARDCGGGNENALQEVENVEEQSGVYWVRERERHLLILCFCAVGVVRYQVCTCTTRNCSDPNPKLYV